MRALGSLALAGAGALCLLAGCGSSGPKHSTAATHWTALRRVTVTTSRPLPPPYGGPFTTSFTTRVELSRVTTALNTHRISQAPASTSNPGCAGGTRIDITIVEMRGNQVHLASYQCANQTSGDIAGDLTGFLSAAGVSTT